MLLVCHLYITKDFVNILLENDLRIQFLGIHYYTQQWQCAKNWEETSDICSVPTHALSLAVIEPIEAYLYIVSLQTTAANQNLFP